MRKEEIKAAIDGIFETAHDQGEAIVAIYRLALPRWDAIEKMHGWPTVGKELSDLIWHKFIEFDQVHHPDCIAGGAWMNNGFSGHGNEHLGPWEIDVSSCKVEYKQ